MEEVWKDINPTIQYSNLDHPPPPHSNPNFILQDFFSGRDPPSTVCSGHPTNTDTPLLPPPNVLSLNSIPPRFDFVHNSSQDLSSAPHSKYSLHLNNNTSTIICNSNSYNGFITQFDGLDSSPPACNFPHLGKRRIQDSLCNTSTCDRRHKRMIKNRESAARSRARKQAYTQELENAVSQLGEENARLKKEQEKLIMAAESHVPKKHTLYRTSTAPF